MMDTAAANFSTAVSGMQNVRVADATGKMKAPQNIGDIEKTAKEFEAVFLSQMLTQMFAGIKTDGMFGGGYAENMYRDLMIGEYGKEIAAAGGLGIADSVKSFMISAQENAQNAPEQQDGQGEK